MIPQKRIMIVEDHPIFRLGLAELINQEEDLSVCGETDDVPSALAQIQGLSPDMIIVDITLKNRDGIELIKEIHRQHKSLPVLVLSMHDESLYAQRALTAGARCYIMKQETSESIIHAIRCVLSGKVYASESIMGDILSQWVGAGPPDKPAIDRLTDRELQVFQLIGQGRTTKEIAEILFLSKKTIGTYRERIKEKLAIKNAAELIRFAVHWVRADHREFPDR